MKLNTIQFGELEFDENLIITFDDGIIGFENLKKFILLKKEDDLFWWLMSVEEPEIAFPLFPVRLLKDEYPESGEAEAFGIVKLNRDPSQVTVNLKAPLYINQGEKIGSQSILDDDSYQIDFNLFVKED